MQNLLSASHVDEQGFADESSSGGPEKRHFDSGDIFADNSISALEIIAVNSSPTNMPEKSANAASSQASSQAYDTGHSPTQDTPLKPLLQTIYPTLELAQTSLQTYFSSLGSSPLVPLSGGLKYYQNFITLVCREFPMDCPARVTLEETPRSGQLRLSEWIDHEHHNMLGSEEEREKTGKGRGKEKVVVTNERSRKDDGWEKENSEAEFSPIEVSRPGASSIHSALPSSSEAPPQSNSSRTALEKPPSFSYSLQPSQSRHQTPTQSTPSIADADSTPPIASTNRANFSPPHLASTFKSPTEKLLEETRARTAKLRQSNVEEAASLARLQSENQRKREEREKKEKDERKKRELKEALEELRAVEEEARRIGEERKKAEAAREESDIEFDSIEQGDNGYGGSIIEDLWGDHE